MDTILKFLGELAGNNNRDWFQANKTWYEKAKSEFEAIVSSVIKGVSTFDMEIQTLNPRDCIFRIYRDTRFTKDKEPYKINMGAFINKGGRNSEYSGYYLHLQPGNSFLGGGKWQPAPDILKAIRYEIYQFPEEFLKIISSKQFIDRFGSLTDEKLQRNPKDFPADFRYIDLLRYKSYIVDKALGDDKLKDKNFIPLVTESFRDMYPLITFLNRAIEHR